MWMKLKHLHRQADYIRRRVEIAKWALAHGAKMAANPLTQDFF
jgi:hypothetical protein